MDKKGFPVFTFLVGALQIVFITLKLCNVINWSWWLVMLPLIIEVGLVVLAVVVSLIALLIALIAENIKERGGY